MKNDQKSDFRISCLKRLEFESRFSKYYKDKKIVNKLKKILDSNIYDNILLYVPLGIEVDVKPLIKYLRIKKKNVYVPFMVEDSFKAIKYRLPLKKKKFGIKEPNNSFFKARKIEIAIVPVVGVDAYGKRIGFGKGMYDRFFWKIKNKPTMIFTQLTLCKSNEILSNEYDIQADYIITG